MASPKPIAIAASSYVSKAERARREYKKARAALLRRISRARKAGYDVSGFTVPKKPKRITEGSVRALKKLSKKFTKYKKANKPPIISEPTPIPSIDDILYERIVELIEYYKYYISSKRQDQERIRHRARLAERKYDDNGFYTDISVKTAALINLEKNFVEIYEKLRLYIIDSKGGYDGDLEQLREVVYLTVVKGEDYNNMTYEQKMRYAEAFSSGEDFEEY